MKARLLMVADLGLLKAFRLEQPEQGSARLIPIEQFSLEPAHQHLTDQLTDSAGRRAPRPGSGGGGTMADRHNLDLEVRRRLIKKLARKIEEIAAGHDADGWWLAAHKEIIHPILEALPQALRARAETRVPRDLTKLEPKDILGHFLAARAEA
jgi:hypothetical protein